MNWFQINPQQLYDYELLLLNESFDDYFFFRAVGRLQHLTVTENPDVQGSLYIYNPCAEGGGFEASFFHGFKTYQDALTHAEFLTQIASKLWTIKAYYWFDEDGLSLADPEIEVIDFPEPYSPKHLCIHV
ncbi:MAG: hypothetical protein RI556_12195 [Hydrogenovibrio sp.]|uniref:hypothetical protein n=1 Tax=Hydrogenovibrio sp. TaxID=2065821 RepID=UPI0028704021|nr:hypothetical protein [Hydrogenovibrio sp.]MDR9499929.1 hypothetical protein [Hydrogenovibrio sp.]